MVSDRLQIICGDAWEVLKTLPGNSVQTCITSPPYYGLRDYGTAQWEGGEDPECEHKRFNAYAHGLNGTVTAQDNGKFFKDTCQICGARRIDSQLGLEATPEEYIEKMVAVFREVWRVLRDDGTLWLNLGDSYNAYNGNRGTKSMYAGDRANFEAAFPSGHGLQCKNLKPKDLCMIPARVALALQAGGWYLRSDIIWHKPNPMPESVTDRPTKAHEYIFLLTKAERYFYDAEAIREPYVESQGGRQTAAKRGTFEYADADYKTRLVGNGHDGLEKSAYTGFRNKRTVWTIATQPNSDSVYDFEGADYVDRRGIPRKWSPDCPIHERDGQPRRENHVTVSCDELKGPEFSRNERNGVNHDQEQGLAGSPIGDYKTNQVEDSSSCVPIDGTCENKKLSGFRPDEREILTGTTHTQSQSVPSTMDFEPLSCAEPAILHNIGDRKSGRVGQMPNGDNVSGQLEFRTEYMEPQLCATGRDGNIVGNNTNPCNDHPKSTVEIVSRKNGKYSSTEDKCLCRKSQVAHYATFPEELPKLCILAGSKPGDTVLDPFAGSGTVGKVALELGRKAILIELNPANIELVKDRTFVTPGFF